MSRKPIEKQVLFNRNVKMSGQSGSSLSEDDNEDVWDDTLLIAAYDKANKLMKEQVAQRLAMKTNTNTSEASKEPKNSTETNNPTENKAQKSQGTEESDMNGTYQIGMNCRCPYSEDGCDYEAKIIGSVEDNLLVRVKFYGYDNEEDVYLSDIEPSHGEHAILEQIHYANIEKELTDSVRNSNENVETDRSNVPPRSNRSSIKFGLPPLSTFQLPSFMPSSLDMNDPMGIPPPPMPFLPDLGRGGGQDDQGLGSMLMSWYMSGYYTGVYQGQKQAANRMRHQRHRM